MTSAGQAGLLTTAPEVFEVVAELGATQPVMALTPSAAYDTNVLGGSIPGFSPSAPLTRCP